MQELRCKKCGLALEQRGDQYICPGCGAKYAAENACRVADEMARLLDEQKQEAVASLRQQLWKEFNEEFYDRAEISRLAKGILNILPDDFFAQFCDLATGRDTRRLNAFLYAADVKAQSMYIWDMLAFLLRPLREETLLAVNDLLARVGAAGLDMEGFRRCNEQLAREAEKLNAGVYDVTLPRDVFLAYSSADMAQVGELVEALEAQKISCFVAARNLQHGAIQNYEEQLRRAMDHCRTVVFVSSKNSRSRTCDALSTELPYIRERDIAAAPQYRNDYAGMPARYKKPRIEYLVDAHTHTAADAIVEEFFEGCEYCYDADTAAQRILGLLTNKPAAAVKYCRSCGTENPVRAKLCLECGGREFVATREEYEQAQRAKAEQSAREAEAVRRAEEEKKKAEEARKRAEEEKRQAEEERKRAEEERRKAEEARRRAEEEEKKKEKARKNEETSTPSVSLSTLKANMKKARRMALKATKYYMREQYDKAAPLYLKAATLGNADAQNNLGVCYSYGYGVKENDEEAVKWFKRAAKQGNEYAQFNLGNHYYYGWGVQKDYTEAVKWYEKAAILGDKDAQSRLGDCYFYGRGVASDYDEAMKCYKKAARQGSAYAQFRLGRGYEEGDGVEQDDGAAIKWYEKAARQGDADAQCYLADCYQEGRCVEQDFSKALKLYRMAAQNGNKQAQRQLGEWYSDGEVVKKDIAESVRWFRKYAATYRAESEFSADTSAAVIETNPDDFEIHDGELVSYSGAGGKRIYVSLFNVNFGYIYVTDDVNTVYCCKGGKLIIPETVRVICDTAFNKFVYDQNGGGGITHILLPANLKEIETDAFANLSDLVEIKIPKGVINIGSDAFSGCTSLRKIVVEQGNEHYHSEGNCLIETETGSLILGCRNSVIPVDGSVTNIVDCAFQDCPEIEQIIVPNCVKKIGDYAFSGCRDLKRITLSDGITTISEEMFASCASLNDIVIPKGVTIIESGAFIGCLCLKKIEIPQGVESIGEYAFSGCASLTNIVIPNSVTTIEQSAFSGCTGLTSITIPSAATSIGENAFDGCDNAKIYCHAKEPEEWPAGWDESLKGGIIWDS